MRTEIKDYIEESRNRHSKSRSENALASILRRREKLLEQIERDRPEDEKSVEKIKGFGIVKKPIVI